MKFRLPSPERCGTIFAVVLAGIGLSIAVAAVRVVRYVDDVRTAAGAGPPSLTGPLRTGPILPCGHPETGYIAGAGPRVSMCSYGHRFQPYGSWYLPTR